MPTSPEPHATHVVIATIAASLRHAHDSPATLVKIGSNAAVECTLHQPGAVPPLHTAADRGHLVIDPHPVRNDAGRLSPRPPCFNDGVDLERLPTFAGDDIFHVVVESPRGSTVKFKYSSALQVFTISRPLPLGLAYPCDWGFVPSTKAEDGDPVDVAVFWDGASFPGVVIPCRALALVKVEQNTAASRARVRNDRVLALPVEDRRSRGSDPAALIGSRLRAEIDLFFVTAAALEDKDARVLGWDSADAALHLLRQSAR